MLRLLPSPVNSLSPQKEETLPSEAFGNCIKKPLCGLDFVIFFFLVEKTQLLFLAALSGK